MEIKLKMVKYLRRLGSNGLLLPKLEINIKVNYPRSTFNLK